MVITFHGDNFFRVSSGSTSVLIDPNSSRHKADLVLKTLADPQRAGRSLAVIDLAGEFNLNSLDVRGIQIIEESSTDFIKTVFSLRGLEDINLAFLGHLSGPPEGDVLEKLNPVDILFLPIGHPPYLSLDQADKIIKQLNPKIVIPAVHGRADLENQLLKELGRPGSIESRLVLKSKDLPASGPVIYLLKSA